MILRANMTWSLFYIVSLCPTFGGSNPGMRAELIHLVKEQLSVICGCALTTHPSAFASISVSRLPLSCIFMLVSQDYAWNLLTWYPSWCVEWILVLSIVSGWQVEVEWKCWQLRHSSESWYSYYQCWSTFLLCTNK